MIQKARGIAAPFDRKVLAAARRIIDGYDIVLRREDGEWYGHAIEYPEAMGDGRTIEACVSETRKALLAAVATMLERGQTPPLAAREGQRTAQVNVRVTPEEKLILESRSRARGYRGLSDYIRASVLAEK